MFVECLAVVMLIVVICYVYLRGGKPGFAFAVLPLVITPAIYLAGNPISKILYTLFGMRPMLSWAFLVLCGAIVSCAFFGYMSRGIHKKSLRTAYAVLCGGFTVLFSWVLILGIIEPILPKIN